MDQDNDTVFSAPEYDALTQHVENAKREIAAKAKTAVGALFKAFFTAHPEIGALKWTQYTPYFNDGEPCEFSVHSDFDVLLGKYVASEGDSDEGDDEEANEFIDNWSVKDKKVAAAINSLGRAVDEDIFLEAFGDHAQVIATPEGFHVTEYDHS